MGPPTFSLDQGALPDVRRRAIRRVLFVLGLTYGGGIAYLLIRHGNRAPDAPLMFVMAVFPALMIPGFRKGVRRACDDWRSYQLILQPEALTRRLADRTELVLARAAITVIDEQPDGTLTVHGPSAIATIAIPPQVLGRAELRAALAGWMPIVPRPARGQGRLALSAALVAMIALMVAAFSADAAYAVPGALALAVVGVWCTWHTVRNVHLDLRTRRSAWLFLIPIIAALAHAFALLAR